MQNRVSCPLCGASNYAVINRRTRRDNVNTHSLKCKCCTTGWQIFLFEGRVLTEEEAEEVGHAVDSPVHVGIPDVGLIRVKWAALLTLPVRPSIREAIEELGHALQRSGLVPDEDVDDETSTEHTVARSHA